MSYVSGKKVVLDLGELHKLCEQCMSAIDEQQDEVVQAAMHRVCDCCMTVKGRLPELQALRQRALNGEVSGKMCA